MQKLVIQLDVWISKITESAKFEVGRDLPDLRRSAVCPGRVRTRPCMDIDRLGRYLYY